MANLKEILPLILAGASGAASPQGADVFGNILAMKEHQENRAMEKEDRELQQEDRLTMLQLQKNKEERAVAEEARAGKREGRASKSAAGVAKVRDITLNRMRREELEATGQDAKSITHREFLQAEYPDIAPLFNDVPYDDMEKIRDKFGAPSIEDQIDKLKIAKDAGMSATLGVEGGSVGTGSTRTEAPPTPFTKFGQDQRGSARSQRSTGGAR